MGTSCWQSHHLSMWGHLKKPAKLVMGPHVPRAALHCPILGGCFQPSGIKWFAGLKWWCRFKFREGLNLSQILPGGLSPAFPMQARTLGLCCPGSSLALTPQALPPLQPQAGSFTSPCPGIPPRPTPLGGPQTPQGGQGRSCRLD